MTQFLLSNFGEAVLEEAITSTDTTLVIDSSLASRFPSPTGDEAFAIILWDGQEAQEIVYCTENDDGVLTVVREREGTAGRAWLAGTKVRHFLTSGTITNLLQEGFLVGNSATLVQAQEGDADNVLMTPERTTDFFEYRTTAITRPFLLATTVEEMRTYMGWATQTFSGTGLETHFELPDPSWDTEFTRVYVDEEYQTSGYTIDGADLDFDTPPPSGTDNIVVVFGQNFAFSVSFPGNNTVSEDALIDGAVTEPKIGSAAVTSNKIAAKAVTLAKLQDITGPGVLGRTTGTGAPQVITPTPEDLGFGSRVANTGDFKLAMRASVPTGWIKPGGTIGNASSGGTNRANADTEALFTLWWNDFANTVLPIYDSAGAVSTRGASAAADFAANKRLKVFELGGEFIRIWDDGRGIDVGRVLGSAQTELVGTHGHTASSSTTGAHTHSTSINLGAYYGFNSGGPKTAWGGSDSYNGNAGGTWGSSSNGDHSHTITVNDHTATENRPRNVAFAGFFKL